MFLFYILQTVWQEVENKTAEEDFWFVISLLCTISDNLHHVDTYS